MNPILSSVLGFIVAIGLLTMIHEFGHFWVARRMGVKVLRFSIGFGKPLFSWHDKQGTEYVIAPIPLGGYVYMLDQNEGPVAPNELHLAFNNKPVLSRMLILVAGPAVNIIFAVLAYSCVFMLGITSIVPVLGDVPKGSAAYAAGLRSGEEIMAIDKHSIATWEDVAVALMSNLGNSHFANITVKNLHTGHVSDHALNLNNWGDNDNSSANLIRNLGLEPYDPMEPIVESVMPDMPAVTAGIKSGDRILSIDGQDITGRMQMLSLLRDKYDRDVRVLIQRQQETLTVLVTPIKKVMESGAVIGFIGIQFENKPWPDNLIRVQKYGPVTALLMGLEKTKDYSILTLQFVGKMVTGKMSLQNVAGPISIAKFAGRTATAGAEYFLSFLALISISLGVLNMLPIPILDGGHLLFCLVELVRGKALSRQVINYARFFGMILIASFMLLAIYNDFVNF